MEPLEGPPVSSPDPAIISSVEQQASSSTHAVSDMLSGSPSVMTHTPQSSTLNFTVRDRVYLGIPNTYASNWQIPNCLAVPDR